MKNFNNLKKSIKVDALWTIKEKKMLKNFKIMKSNKKLKMKNKILEYLPKTFITTK